MTEPKRIDNMSEEEFYEYRRNLIKDTFTEKDFLSCEITRKRLFNEFFWKWDKNCAPKIENYYNGMREEVRGTFTTPFFYDRHGDFSSELNGIVFKYIKKEYDISIFQECPTLAEPLIKQYEEIQQKKKDELKVKREVAVIKSTEFEWGKNTEIKDV